MGPTGRAISMATGQRPGFSPLGGKRFPPAWAARRLRSARQGALLDCAACLTADCRFKDVIHPVRPLTQTAMAGRSERMLASPWAYVLLAAFALVLFLSGIATLPPTDRD